MDRTENEKKEFVAEIFSDRTLFEEEVLQVFTEADRVEVMQIIAQSLVGDKLKEEINFLYLDTLRKFKLSSIVGTIFNQFANEWLSFAVEVLGYSKESALQEIQEKKRAAFVHSIATLYFKEYGQYIFETIADTFIDLINTFPHANGEHKLINEILQSDLVLDNQVLIIQSFQQLWSKVRSANNLKNSHISKIQVAMSQLTSELLKEGLDEEIKVTLQSSVGRHEEELSQLRDYSLDKFDEALKRLKYTMVNSMARMSSI